MNIGKSTTSRCEGKKISLEINKEKITSLVHKVFSQQRTPHSQQTTAVYMIAFILYMCNIDCYTTPMDSYFSYRHASCCAKSDIAYFRNSKPQCLIKYLIATMTPTSSTVDYCRLQCIKHTHVISAFYSENHIQ